MDKKLNNLEQTAQALDKLKNNLQVVGIGKEEPNTQQKQEDAVTNTLTAQPEDSVVDNATVVAQETQEPQPKVETLKASEIRALFQGLDFKNESVTKLFDSLVDKPNVTAQEVKAALWNFTQDNKQDNSVITTVNRGYGNALNTPLHNGALTMEKAKGAEFYNEPHFSRIYNELGQSNRSEILASTDTPKGLKEFMKDPSANTKRKFYELCVEVGKAKGITNTGLSWQQRDEQLNYALTALGRGDFQEYWQGLRTTIHQLQLEEPEIQVLDLVERVGMPQAGLNVVHSFFDNGAGYVGTADGNATYEYKLQTRTVNLDSQNYNMGYAINMNALSKAITGFDNIPAYLRQCAIQHDKLVVEKLGAVIAQSYLDSVALTNKTALKTYGYDTYQAIDLARVELDKVRHQEKRLNCVVVPEALRLQTEILFNSTSLPGAPNSGTHNPINGFDKNTRVIYSNFIINHLPENEKFTVFAFNIDNCKIYYHEESGYGPKIYQYEDVATRTYHLAAQTQLDVGLVCPEDVIAIKHSLTLPAFNNVHAMFTSTEFTDYHDKADKLGGPATPTI